MSSILIKNGYILSMSSKYPQPDFYGDIYIINNKIMEVGKIDKPADKVIDASGKIIMPGFINCHTNVAMSLFKGLNDEIAYSDLQKETLAPIEEKMTPEDVYNASMLSIIEMIKSGTTTFCDTYFHEDSVAKAAEDSGMRAMVASRVMGEAEKADESLKKAEDLYNNWNNKADGRVKVCIGIDQPYLCSSATITKATELAKRLKTLITMNYLESKEQIRLVREKYSRRITDYLKDLEFFTAKTLLAHGVWADELDISELITHDTAIVNTPVRDCKTGSGIADIKMLIESGIVCAMGTDNSNCAGTLDMFDHIKTSAYTQKVLYKDAMAIHGDYVLKMATRNGAKALGLEEDIGTIEEDMKADLIIINIQTPRLLPIHNIYSTLAYGVQGSDVETSIINGEIVMENGKLTKLDEEKILENVRKSAERLFTK